MHLAHVEWVYGRAARGPSCGCCQVGKKSARVLLGEICCPSEGDLFRLGFFAYLGGLCGIAIASLIRTLCYRYLLSLSL